MLVKLSPGRNKGLVIMLDAHSDDFAPGSRDEDFQGFRAIIESRGSFPLIGREGLPIRSGVNFAHILRSAFTSADPKSAKRQ